MRNVAVLLAVITLAVVLVAVAAPGSKSPVAVSPVFAQGAVAGVGPPPIISKQCYSVPCFGNYKREAIYERIGNNKRDLIRTFDSEDRIHANTYSKDRDQGFGYGGNDFIFVNDGDTLDGAEGGTGYDWCVVDATIEAANTCDKVVVR